MFVRQVSKPKRQDNILAAVLRQAVGATGTFDELSVPSGVEGPIAPNIARPENRNCG